MIKSAGILLYRFNRAVNGRLEVLLAHPGGPLWAKKDTGAWSIPKGEFGDEENALDAAVREFEEETGSTVKSDLIALSPVKQKGGKMVYAWASEGDLDAAKIKSNLFEMEWPPRSGMKKQYPEIDRAEWFSVEEARIKINPAQMKLIEELEQKLKTKN